MVRGDYVHSVRRHIWRNKESLSIQTEEDPNEERLCPQLVEGLKKIEADEPGKVVNIKATLPKDQEEPLVFLLIEFKELFA